MVALRHGRFMIAVTKHLTGDLDGLALETERELPALLIGLLEEIEAANPLNCYAGMRPPQRSYEPEIRGQELWAYSWESERCGKPMYLKFALKQGRYLYVDCHEDSPESAR